jgi:hypothetical protein
LNVVALVSVVVVLPETRGVSLERMDVLFGEVDAVDAGEREVGVAAKRVERLAFGGGVDGGSEGSGEGEKGLGSEIKEVEYSR